MLYFKEVVFQFILQFEKYISNMHVSILNKTIVYRQYIFRIIFVTKMWVLKLLLLSNWCATCECWAELHQNRPILNIGVSGFISKCMVLKFMTGQQGDPGIINPWFIKAKRTSSVIFSFTGAEFSRILVQSGPRIT